MNTTTQTYSPAEERLNVWSHAVGILLALIALVALLHKAWEQGSMWDWIAYPVYGISVLAIFTASTLYHNAKAPQLRRRLKIFDHAAIYLGNAGTYTPFCLLTIRGPWGWGVLVAVWSIALAGIILKLFFTGRFKLASTIGYVAMGWIIVFALKPLMEHLPLPNLLWLAAGGALYSIGAVLYQIKRIPFNHALFHFFVLAAAICHFIAVYRL